uniref:Uncharacterized protein n=1 Tax=Trichuris muris TaxID=70415 RepID=A0A5S6QCQ6_TRIMR
MNWSRTTELRREFQQRQRSYNFGDVDHLRVAQLLHERGCNCARRGKGARDVVFALGEAPPGEAGRNGKRGNGKCRATIDSAPPEQARGGRVCFFAQLEINVVLVHHGGGPFRKANRPRRDERAT